MIGDTILLIASGILAVAVVALSARERTRAARLTPADDHSSLDGLRAADVQGTRPSVFAEDEADSDLDINVVNDDESAEDDKGEFEDFGGTVTDQGAATHDEGAGPDYLTDAPIE